MSNLVTLLCVVAGLIIIAIGLGRAAKQSDKKYPETRVTERPSQTQNRPKWQNWLLPIGLALVLAIWTIWGALFFLAVVWVVRLNPKTDSKEIPFPSDDDRKRAKGTYTWLWLSPFLNVIILVIGVINLSSKSSINERVAIALLPLVFHLPVLIRLDSKNPFVFRHTQQAIILLALRAGMAALALSINKYPYDGIWLFLLGNGSLWLFGTLWGRNQVIRNDCWWMRRKGETTAQPQEQPITDDELDVLVKGLDAEGNTVRRNALNAFRKGTPETRKKAVLVLSKLGEVEEF